MLARLDAFQRRHAPVAFAIGVVKKFGDDRAGRLAALIAYYAFFSLFPLLLVGVTVVAYVVGERSAEELETSALEQIPLLGEQIGRQVEPLSGSVVALAIGSVTALWAGLGCMQAAQDGMNEIWDVPRLERASFARKRLRSLVTLAVIGLAVATSTVASQVLVELPGFLSDLPFLGTAVALVVNVAAFTVAFEMLATGRQRIGVVLPGAAVAGIGYTALQYLGNWYVDRTIRGAQDTYGVFATVIGLLSWLFLVAQWSLLAAEVNVVRTRRLWPRGLRLEDPTDADRAVVLAKARTARLRPDTRIVVEIREAR